LVFEQDEENTIPRASKHAWKKNRLLFISLSPFVNTKVHRRSRVCTHVNKRRPIGWAGVKSKRCQVGLKYEVLIQELI
jgi:hypothetical protein